MGEGRGIYSVAMFQKERHLLSADVFPFGFRRLKGGSTLRHLNARDCKAIPAPKFSPAAKTLVRRKGTAGQKAGGIVPLYYSLGTSKYRS